MFSSKWLKASQSGYGVVLVLMVLVSSMLLASSFKFTRGSSLNSQTTALHNNTIATQVANYGLEAFRADIVTRLKAGTTISTSYRYPSSGTNNVTVPDDPSNLTGASSTVGNYFGTVTQVRGNYYLLGVTAVVGSSTVTASRLIDITLALVDVRFLGRNASDSMGSNVSSVGDVNGDGYDDLMLGAHGADGGGSASGEAYLVLGRSNTSWRSLTDSNGDFNLDNMSDANLTVRFIGRRANDRAGYSVSGAGDVNNDGYDDIIIGAYDSDPSGGGVDAGEAYIILGRSTVAWATLTDVGGDFNLDNTSDANLMVRFIGRNASDYMGHSVSGAGDVNNDGYDDIVIGADESDGGGADSGETYLILGRSTTDWATLTDASGDFNLDSISDANLMVRFIGRSASDWSGATVSSARDVNNDGYDDIILGANGADGGGSSAGEAYILLGRDTAAWATLTPTTNGDFNLTNTSDANLTVRFIGRNAFDMIGNDPATVSDVGDVNNDGYDDIILGALGADGGGNSSGEAYLILGRSTAAWATLTDASGDFNLDNISDANLMVRFIGRNASDETGYSVSGARDVNNDGYDDIILGARMSNSGGTYSGETYLILGRSTTDWATLTPTTNGDFDLDNMSDANLMVRFIGRNAGDNVGQNVSDAGDVNNDGYDDVMMGSLSADGGATDAGEGYLFFGRTTAKWASLTDASGDYNLDNI